MQQETEMMTHAFEAAKLKELYSKAASNIAMARERNGRLESNLGLYEERLSMIERNRAMSIKEKQEAIAKMLENVEKFGAIETQLKENQLESIETEQLFREEREKQEVHSATEANKFLTEIMGSIPGPQMGGQG
jgi:hypothetical protein